jgi:superfamily II RNA helicase
MQHEYPVTLMLPQLERDQLLPAILFRTARKQCDADIMAVSRNRRLLLPLDHQHRLETEVVEIVKKYDLDRDVVMHHEHYPALVQTGCGAHHAGQLLLWRLLLEELMSRGALRLLVATGTVAAGVDFPARTVVITAHSKRGSEGFNTLTSAEFQQMSGRAGRRGKDAVGFCLIAPGAFSDARVLLEVSKRPPEPLRSAYFASPSTVLNLLKYRNVDDLLFTVQRSLAAFIDRRRAEKMRLEAQQLQEELGEADQESRREKKAEKRARRWLREADEVEVTQQRTLERMLEGLGRLGYVEDGKLTEKGGWAASICTNLVLELGEAISEFLFADLQLEETVALIASISGDPHRSYLAIAKNPIKKELYQKMTKVLERVRGAFEKPPNAEIKVMPEAALSVLSWLSAESWIEYSSVLRLAGVAEGDAARLIMQTAEHLGQIARLKETHPDLAAQCAEARTRLLRPPLSETLAV